MDAPNTKAYQLSKETCNTPSHIIPCNRPTRSTAHWSQWEGSPAISVYSISINIHKWWYPEIILKRCLMGKPPIFKITVKWEIVTTWKFRIASFGMHSHVLLSHSPLYQIPLAALKCRVFLINPGFQYQERGLLRMNNLALWASLIYLFWSSWDRICTSARELGDQRRMTLWRNNVIPPHMDALQPLEAGVSVKIFLQGIYWVVSQSKKIHVAPHAWRPYEHIHMVACSLYIPSCHWSLVIPVDQTTILSAPAVGPDHPEHGNHQGEPASPSANRYDLKTKELQPRLSSRRFKKLQGNERSIL